MERTLEKMMKGDVHGGGSGTVLGLPTQVEARSYGDVYGNGFYWAAGLGYRVGEAGEIRVQGSYTANPADRLQVGTVAVVRVDTIQSEFSVPAASVVLSHVNMYDTSVVPSVGAGGRGADQSLRQVRGPGGVEFKWQGDATDLDGLAGTGLESINDQSRRWSMPITGGITVRF